MMKIRADLKLVKQLDYISEDFVDFSGDKCFGCSLSATRDEVSSLCQRVNLSSLTCGSDKIWVIDEKQWSSFKGKE